MEVFIYLFWLSRESTLFNPTEGVLPRTMTLNAWTLLIFFLLQPRAVIANVSSFNVQHRQNHAILTSSSDIRTMCGFPVSFLESHLIESRLARANVWESFRRDPFHVSSLRPSWTSWAQTFLTCGLWTQICLPIEYPYRILSIFPTDSRRNQAGTSIVSTLDTAYEDMTPR